MFSTKVCCIIWYFGAFDAYEAKVDVISNHKEHKRRPFYELNVGIGPIFSVYSELNRVCSSNVDRISDRLEQGLRNLSGYQNVNQEKFILPVAENFQYRLQTSSFPWSPKLEFFHCLPIESSKVGHRCTLCLQQVR